MKPIVVVVIIAGVIVLICVFGARQRLGIVTARSKPAANVLLTVQGGVCKVEEPVEILGGAWKKKLTWIVKNECPEAQYVGFLEYRRRLAGDGLGSPEHIVNPDPAYSKRLALNDTDKVDSQIDKFNWNPFSDKTYKYKICVTTTPNPAANCLDPDVDVWPF